MPCLSCFPGISNVVDSCDSCCSRCWCSYEVLHPLNRTSASVTDLTAWRTPSAVRSLRTMSVPLHTAICILDVFPGFMFLFFCNLFIFICQLPFTNLSTTCQKEKKKKEKVTIYKTLPKLTYLKKKTKQYFKLKTKKTN